MTERSGPASRAEIIDKYSALARMALAGDPQFDCDPDAFTAGCFGAAGYPSDTSGEYGVALRASLGCGNPLAVADLQPGQTILDLGSGGGLDVLLSARRVGPAGIAYGLDASPDMLALARANAARAGITNARFLAGHIEDIPLPDEHVDVIISNCVINLSGDKARVLTEAFRVLRPGGQLSVSDMVTDDDVDPGQVAEAEQRTGCIAGAVAQSQYRELLQAAGFIGVTMTPTQAAGPGLYSAIIRAARPAIAADHQGAADCW